MTSYPFNGIGSADASVILFNKGGRDSRLKLLEAGKEAPREFFYGYFDLVQRGYSTSVLSTADAYPGVVGGLLSLWEQAWTRTTHFCPRLHHVALSQPWLRQARVAISFTDGYSLTLGQYYRRRKKGPFIAGGFHGLSDIETRSPPWARPLVAWQIRRALQGLDHAFFFGPADRDFAIRHYGLDAGRTSIFRFGVDTEFWRPADVVAEDVFVAVGQDPNRHYDLLAQAPTKHRIAIITRLPVAVPPGRDNVTISAGSYFNPGTLTDERVRELYQRALAVVVPLRDVWQPTGYSVTLQAMACGKPVILSRIRGLWAPELLRDGENCLLVTPGDAGALAAALDRVAADAALRERLGKAARTTAERHFHLGVMADDVEALVRRGLNR